MKPAILLSAMALIELAAPAQATVYCNTFDGYQYCSGTDGYTSYSQKSFQGYDIGSDNRGNSWIGTPDGRGGEAWDFRHQD